MGLYKRCTCGAAGHADRRARREARRGAWARCPHPWCYTFTLPGQNPVRASTVFRDKKSAQAELDEARRQARLGDLGLLVPVAPTVADFASDYLTTDAAVNCPRSVDRYTQASAQVGKRLGTKRLSQITSEDVEAYKKARRDDGAAVATINRELAFLRRLYNVALSRGKVRHTPFRHNGAVVVRLFQEDNQRERYLTADEEMKVLAACAHVKPWLLAIVQVALHTGLRRGAILTLQIRDVNFATNVITLRATNSKSKRQLRLPMNLLVQQVLAGHTTFSDGKPKPPGALVFLNEADEPITKNALRFHWERAATAAGLVAFHFHDLRHTFASRLVGKNVPLLHVSKLLGHSTIVVTQRYAHASDAQLEAAVTKLIDTGTPPDPEFTQDSPRPDPAPSPTGASVVQ